MCCVHYALRGPLPTLSCSINQSNLNREISQYHFDSSMFLQCSPSSGEFRGILCAHSRQFFISTFLKKIFSLHLNMIFFRLPAANFYLPHHSIFHNIYLQINSQDFSIDELVSLKKNKRGVVCETKWK